MADHRRRNGTRQALACIDAAFDLGIDFIDTANAYGLGQPRQFLAKRSRTVCATAIVGASRLDQLAENAAAIDLSIDPVLFTGAEELRQAYRVHEPYAFEDKFVT